MLRCVSITPRPIAAGDGWRITEFLCDAGPQDRVFEERHREIGVALVTRGTFRYRCVQGSAVLAPGSLLLAIRGLLRMRSRAQPWRPLYLVSVHAGVLRACRRRSPCGPQHRVFGTQPAAGGGVAIRTRLRRAAVRLLESTEPVSTVAYECGFADLSTFNRQFRRAMGVSPGQFRLTTGPVQAARPVQAAARAAQPRASLPARGRARPQPVSVRTEPPVAKAG